MLSAIITAGGIPKEGEPLYPLTQGKPKALLEIAGKPMIQWILDALDDAQEIDQVVLVGLDKQNGLKSDKLAAVIENQSDMLANIRAGVVKVLEINPKLDHVVVVSSDIPAITGEMVDWLVQTTMQTDEDVYYTVISKEVMERKYPNSKRSYTHLKDIDVCGGDINVIRTMTATSNDKMWKKIIDSRKNVFKQAALVGYDTLILLLLKQITLDQAVKMVAPRLDVTGRAILSPYAEMGMDIDKPHQFEIVEADLRSRVQKSRAI
ncbi:MAG: NTP transferase domain-containing protein, partial [Anaerolineales bacterium]